MPVFRFENSILLFVHIPKTGGTSVEKLLKQAGGIEALRDSVQIPGLPCTPQHFHAEIITRLIPASFYDFAFTIARNPFDRLASEFKMRVVDGGRDIGFDAWVERVLARHAKNPFANDNHIRPQSEFMFDGLEIFRFEFNPMLQVCDRLRQFGVRAPLEIPWERRGAELKLRMSAATADRIVDFYAGDFEQFGYRRDDYGTSLVIAGGA